jgi:hypothetical protein
LEQISFPLIPLRRITPSATDLITGISPILNVNIALLLTLRTILGSSSITLAGDVTLNANDQIGLFYVSNGLTIILSLGSTSNEDIVWSIHQLS